MSWWNRLNNFDKYNGNDYTKNYVKNKNAYFYIGREDSPQEIVVFKPFLTELSYDLKVSTKDSLEVLTNANPAKIITDSTYVMKVAMSVPAISVSEAKANKMKVSKLLSWLRDPYKVPTKKGSGNPDTCANVISELRSNGYTIKNGKITSKKEGAVESLKTNRPQYWATAKSCAKKLSTSDKGKGKLSGNTYHGKNMVFRISFANLIQSGNYNEMHEILSSSRKKTEENMNSYALRCFVSNVNVKVDLDMGFFEEDGDMIPKAFEVAFDIEIINRFSTGETRNILGFGLKSESGDKYKNSNYHKYDVKYWPFGVKSGSDSKIVDSPEYQYTQKSNAMIKFKKYTHEISFLPLLTAFSIDRKTNSKALQEFKHLTGKDRIIYDTKMPTFKVSFQVQAINLSHSKLVLYNLQKLMRMSYGFMCCHIMSVAHLRQDTCLEPKQITEDAMQ